MRTDATLSEKDKGTLAKLKDMTTAHNTSVPSQYINFQALFAKATDVQDLNKLVRKAISDAVARSKAPKPTVFKKDETEQAAEKFVPAAASPSPAKKIPVETKVKKTVIVVSGAPYVPPPTPTIDLYPGLGLKARKYAVMLKTNGVGSMMSGPTTKASELTQTDLNELRTWVEAQQTPSGLQKWVTNVGWGTGQYNGRWQFKVTGFGTTSTSTSAPTWHLWINDNLT